MAHRQQIEFVRAIAASCPGYFEGVKVLEVGSLDINGSIRALFPGCEYTGLDVAPGPGVDVVCQAQDYDGPSDHYDVVASCEAMEHNPYWKQTLVNMMRVLKPGGLLLMTCATRGRREHGTSNESPESSPLTVDLGWQYYRNLTDRDFSRAVDLDAILGWHRFWTNWESFDLYLCGFKKNDGEGNAEWGCRASLEDKVRDLLAQGNGSKRCVARRVVAATAGDSGFRVIRSVAKALQEVGAEEVTGARSVTRRVIASTAGDSGLRVIRNMAGTLDYVFA